MCWKNWLVFSAFWIKHCSCEYRTQSIRFVCCCCTIVFPFSTEDGFLSISKRFRWIKRFVFQLIFDWLWNKVCFQKVHYPLHVNASHCGAWKWMYCIILHWKIFEMSEHKLHIGENTVKQKNRAFPFLAVVLCDSNNHCASVLWSRHFHHCVRKNFSLDLRPKFTFSIV